MYRPSDRELLGQTMVSARSFDQLLRFWEALGWVEVTKAFQVVDNFEDGDDARIIYMARARRLRATPSLMEVGDQHGIRPQTIRIHFIEDRRRLLPVVVRSAGGGQAEQEGTVKSCSP